jgi:hypothetical protein
MFADGAVTIVPRENNNLPSVTLDTVTDIPPLVTVKNALLDWLS